MKRDSSGRTVDANGNILYCVATHTFTNGAFAPHLYYLHAKDVGEARLAFCRSHPNRRTVQIIMIAPVVGWLHAGQDKSGSVVKDVFEAD